MPYENELLATVFRSCLLHIIKLSFFDDLLLLRPQLDYFCDLQKFVNHQFQRFQLFSHALFLQGNG